MRFVVYGAGAVGATIGARLFQHGHEVVLIARGAHAKVMRDDGLRLLDPAGQAVLRLPVAESPAEVGWADGDVVLLAMKSQDTEPALEELAAAVPDGALPVVCAQNGVANERRALRRFENVYGMCVMLPASLLEPGVVEANGTPLTGMLDVGRYPGGTDAVAEEVAAALEESTFSSRALPDVMRWKHRKLLSNLANAVEALCGPAVRDAAAEPLVRAAREEGETCLAAAGAAVASDEEDAERRADLVRMRPAAGRRRLGGSTWQSLQRGSPSVETDFLNGEIVLLGRLHGVPTPVNAFLQARMRRALRERTPAGSVPVADLLAELERAHR
jgi:2-dehydropantoate 2-reductase